MNEKFIRAIGKTSNVNGGLFGRFVLYCCRGKMKRIGLNFSGFCCENLFQFVGNLLCTKPGFLMKIASVRA